MKETTKSQTLLGRIRAFDARCDGYILQRWGISPRDQWKIAASITVAAAIIILAIAAICLGRPS